ncbi:S8 family serine peptidase [Planctomycetota bacterium]
MGRGFFKIILCMAVLLCLCSEAFGLAESTGPGGSNAQAIATACQNADGIKVGLLGGQNVLTSHEAFSGMTLVNHAAPGLTVLTGWHDTIAAGIIAAQPGTSHPDDIGIAPGAEIHSMRISNNLNVLTGLDSLVTTYNCRVIASVYSLSGIDNDGDSDVTLRYDYHAYNNNVIFANPAGQHPDFNIPGDSYNAIVTAGIKLKDVNDEYDYRMIGGESLSGLTLDGRRKPDIAGPSAAQTVPTTWDGVTASWTNTNGVGGSSGATSWSTPHTAGVAALLLKFADGTAEPDDGRNVVIKSVIVNSTFPNIDDKTGSSTNPADSANTWQADRGYGRIDALRAYQILSANRVARDVDITAEKGWAYETVAATEPHNYFIWCERNQRLVVTTTWSRRVNKQGPNYNPESEPRFDLDITIVDPNGQTVPLVNDAINNLIKADILIAEDGYYHVELVNSSDKTNRTYAMAFELLDPIAGDLYPADYIVDYNDIDILTGQWLLSGTGYEADIVVDANVNFFDFAELSQHWFEIDPAYYNP